MCSTTSCHIDSNQSLSPLGTSLLCFHFYTLCYAAVPLKITYYAQCYAQEQELLSDYYVLYAVLHEQFTTCSTLFL